MLRHIGSFAVELLQSVSTLLIVGGWLTSLVAIANAGCLAGSAPEDLFLDVGSGSSANSSKNSVIEAR